MRLLDSSPTLVFYTLFGLAESISAASAQEQQDDDDTAAVAAEAAEFFGQQEYAGDGAASAYGI